MEVPANQAKTHGKSASSGGPALPRDTYYVCLAIYVDSSESAMFSACH